MDGTPEPSAPEPTPGAWSPPPPAPKPGVIPLRVLTFNEILSGAFQTLRRHPGLLLGSAGVLLVVPQVVGLFLMLPLVDLYQQVLVEAERLRPGVVPDEFFSLVQRTIVAALVVGLLSALGQVFLTGLVTVVVGRAVIGRPITPGGAWAELRPRMWRLIAVSILYGIAVVTGTLLCIVPGVWVSVLFSLAVPAVVLEKLPIRRSFKRSQALVTNAWWSVFGMLVAVHILAGVVGYLVSLPFSVDFDYNPTKAFSVSTIVLGTLVAIVVGAVTAPFVSAVTALVYLDRRIEVERFDVQLAQAAQQP